jgi:cell wall-associated NlpC family hydrolase
MPARRTAALLAVALCTLAPAAAHGQDPQGDWDTPGVAEPAPLPAPVPVQPGAPGLLPAPVPAPPPPPPPVPVMPVIAPTKMVPGKVAMLRTDGKAAIPRGAPKRVQALIATANRIVGKPYKWGGGHARIADSGYDCSGTVSYALLGTGMLAAPMVSGSFSHWQTAGAGRWLTVYANAGHVYLEAAGLRLDTSPAGDPRGGDGPRWRPLIGARRGFHVRHPAGL